MSAKKWLYTLGLSFALAATACRKDAPAAPQPPAGPNIHQQTYDNSVAATDTGAVVNATFHSRFISIISRCSERDLQTLKDHNVVIALDQRLSAQHISFFYPTVEAAYFRKGDTAVLCLWDNGKGTGDDNYYYLRHTPHFVRLLAERLRAGDTSDIQLYGGRFKDDNGKKEMAWRKPTDGFKKTIQNNPLLASPPDAVFDCWELDESLMPKAKKQKKNDCRL